MNDDEKRIFIELNGYDPTTREGQIKHIDNLKARHVAMLERVAGATQRNNDHLRISCEIAADSIERNIREAYAVLGRIVYDDATRTAPSDADA